MWMQLGNRAFVAGAAQRRRDVREGKTDASVKKPSMHRQVPPKESVGALPGMDTFRLQDQRAIILTIGSDGHDKNETPTEPIECVFLTNPTMEDLRSLVQSVKAKKARKQVIILPQSQTTSAKQPQTAQETPLTMEQSVAEMNNLLKFERSEMERLAISRALQRHVKLPNCRCRKMSHHLRVVPKPMLHDVFCVDEEDKDKELQQKQQYARKMQSCSGTFDHAYNVAPQEMGNRPMCKFMQANSYGAMYSSLDEMDQKIVKLMSQLNHSTRGIDSLQQQKQQQKEKEQRPSRGIDMRKLQSPVQGLDIETWLKLNASVARAKQAVDAAVRDEQAAVALEQAAKEKSTVPAAPRKPLIDTIFVALAHWFFMLYFLCP